jgi:hypothetical protein
VQSTIFSKSASYLVRNPLDKLNCELTRRLCGGNLPALRSYEKAGFRFVPVIVFSPEVEMELPL